VKRAEGIHRKHLMNQTSANEYEPMALYSPCFFGVKHFSLQGKGLICRKHLNNRTVIRIKENTEQSCGFSPLSAELSIFTNISNNAFYHFRCVSFKNITIK